MWPNSTDSLPAAVCLFVPVAPGGRSLGWLWDALLWLVLYCRYCGCILCVKPVLSENSETFKFQFIWITGKNLGCKANINKCDCEATRNKTLFKTILSSPAGSMTPCFIWGYVVIHVRFPLCRHWICSADEVTSERCSGCWDRVRVVAPPEVRLRSDSVAQILLYLDFLLLLWS